MHMLAAQGYCVVAIDSRGSQHRGLAFESHLKGRMVSLQFHIYRKVQQFLSHGFLNIYLNWRLEFSFFMYRVLWNYRIKSKYCSG